MSVGGSSPDQATVGLPRSTQPSITPGGKSTTGLIGWGYGGARSLVFGGK